MVSVYIEIRPLMFWDFMSHFTHKLTIFGNKGYFWILIYYPKIFCPVNSIQNPSYQPPSQWTALDCTQILHCPIFACPVNSWVLPWVFYWIDKTKYPRNNWKAYQIRPQQAFKVFKKVTNVRVNSRPGETYPYKVYNIYLSTKKITSLTWNHPKI